MRIAIVGAGIVGVTVAHALLDEGHSVDLIDREGIAAGTSRGNAGWIAHIDILPLASPKVWRHVPRWLTDPLGPMSIRPAYLLRLTPWALRFISASRPAAIERNTVALSALQLRALPSWERRLAALGLERMLRRSGSLYVWSSTHAYAAVPALARRQAELGIPVELLDMAAVRRMEPALGSFVVGGAWYPTGAHVADPREVTEAVGQAALARGVRLARQTVSAVRPTEGGIAVKSSGAPNAIYDRVVVAAGAWSRPLAAMLGDKVPLDTERGYNVTLPTGSLGLTRPVAFEGHGFVTTPLASGDRIGGSVEFGGLEAAPDYARVDAILGRARRFLPDLGKVEGTRWMGFRPSMPDSLPVIGPASADRRIVYAFGHGHYGLTQAAVTAEILAALVAGRTAAVDPTPYSPKRF